MPSFNKITIVGHLGRDVVLRYLPSGESVADFSVATSEKRGDQETTTWFKITVWGKRAETCNQFLAKGSLVYVEGRLKQTEYTDREGNKRTTLEVNASEVQFLSGKKSDDDPVPQSKAAAVLNAQAPPSDTDIPF